MKPLLIAAALVPLGRSAIPARPEPDRDVTLVVYDSFPDEGTHVDALERFTDETGIGVELLVAGDTGTMVAKAVLTAGNPEGDVMWGVDNTYLSRVVDEGVFEPYAADGVDDIDAELRRVRTRTRGDAGRLRRRLRQLRHRLVRRQWHRAAATSSPWRAGLRRPPRRREPGVVLARSGLPDGDGRRVRRGRLDRLLGAPRRQRRGGRRRLDGGLLRALQRSQRRTQAARRQLRDEPARRGALRRPTGRRGADGRRHRDVLPPGRVRRGAARHRRPDEARRLVDFLVSEEFQSEVALNLFVYPVHDGSSFPPSSPTRSSPTTRTRSIQDDRRAPRVLDRHGRSGPRRPPPAGCLRNTLTSPLSTSAGGDRSVNRLPRWFVPALAAAPVVVLVVFYAWPLVTVLARGLSRRRSPNPGRPGHLGGRLVHVVAGRPLHGADHRRRPGARLRHRPLRLPRSAPARQRPRGRVRAPDRGARRRRAGRPAGLDRTRAWWRSSSPTCSSTSPSSCAPSAPSSPRCPATVRRRGDARGVAAAGCSARSPCRRSSRRSARRRDRLRVHVHLLRRGPHPR